MISKNKARELVEKHLNEQDLNGFVYEFVKVNIIDTSPEEFGVVFDVFTSDGEIIDGPAVFLVNKKSGAINTL